jgi:hypothetical protein
MFPYVFVSAIVKELRADIRFHKGFRRFRSLIETAESASAVSLRPLNQLPLSHWDRRIRFRGLIEAAEPEAKLF